MAAPSYASSATSTASEGTSKEAVAPVRSPEDILTGHLYLYGGASVTTPEGWTLIPPTPTPAPTTAFQIFSYFRPATNTSADNFKASWTGTLYAEAEILRITGGATASTINASSADNSGTSTSPAALTMKTTVAETLGVLVMGPDHAGTYTPPAGFTTRVSAGGNLIATGPIAAIGETGTLTGTLSESMKWACHVFAIAPKEEGLIIPSSLGLVGVGR
jgi:hypothetical protein